VIERDKNREAAHSLSLLVQDAVSREDVTGDAEDEHFENGLQYVSPPGKWPDRGRARAHLEDGHDKGPVRCPHPRTRVRRVRRWWWLQGERGAGLLIAGVGTTD
jgi:hypothetical protein